MRLEINIPEHHYNNIMAFDSVSLGRVPYKGIIMYAINAIKHGRVLEQEPTTKNDLGVDCISRTSALDSINWAYNLSDAYQKINDLPSVTPQEPFVNKPCVSSGVCEHDKQKVLNKIREQIKSHLRGVEITLEVLVENDPLIPKMEGAKVTLEECLELIDKAEAEADNG